MQGRQDHMLEILLGRFWNSGTDDRTKEALSGNNIRPGEREEKILRSRDNNAERFGRFRGKQQHRGIVNDFRNPGKTGEIPFRGVEKIDF